LNYSSIDLKCVEKIFRYRTKNVFDSGPKYKLHSLNSYIYMRIIRSGGFIEVIKKIRNTLGRDIVYRY